MSRLVRVLFVALLGCPLALHAQGRFPPDSATNLRVLDQGTPMRDIINTMRGFAIGLGVRCQYCHLGEEGRPLSTFDFASDERRTKQTARVMLRMVREINGQHLTQIPGRPTPAVEVTCETCHRGVPRPIPLDELLLRTASESGADSAIRAYRQLRTEYYGRASYDFGELTLIGVGLRYARSAAPADGLALLRLNEEFFPRSANTAMAMGELHAASGDTTAAVAAFREAIARDPAAAGQAGRRLRQLGVRP